MASVDLQEKANFTRLSRLLVDKGTEALRNTFDAIHPPAKLQAVLAANRAPLLRLKPRVINNPQWDLLFPPSGNPPDSKTFDVTLLTVLFRNICGLPSTGWSAMPLDTDRSMQANIVRIKLLRNEIYAHVASTQVDNATFESLWQKISQALVELNIPQHDVDGLKTCPLGPEEEIYVKTLKKWKSQEEESMKVLTSIAEENRDGIKYLCQSAVQQQSNIEALQSLISHSSQVSKDTDHQKNCSKESDEDLLQKLAKHNFKSKIRGEVEFFHHGTREWLLQQVDEFVAKEQKSRMLLLTAGPGFGKSVFAAKVCEDFKKKGKLAASHYCDFRDSNLRDPMMMLQSLASQMCENIAGFKEKLLDQLRRPHQVRSLKDALRIYLQNPLDELDLEEPSLVVIDGLDESEADDKNEMMNLIADYFPDLPKCIKFLVTSRPEISIAKLSNVQKINIDSDDANNNSDLELYLKACLPSLANKKAEIPGFINFQHGDPLSTSVCDVLAKKKCEGSFLYAFYVQSELRKRDDLHKITLDEIMEFVPKGLDSIYLRYFNRLEEELRAIVPDNLDVLRILEMLAVSKGPLPLSFISRALGLAPDCRETRNIVNKVNERVSCLLYVSDDLVTVFHKSVIDWLLAEGYKDHEYTAKVGDGNKYLWLLCEQVFAEIKKTDFSGDNLSLTNDVKYALCHGPQHLVACEMKESFFWLADVVIIHALLTVHFKSTENYLRSIFNIWVEVLQDAVIIDDKLRARISWHVTEIEFADRLHNWEPLSWKNSQFNYLQSVLTHSPEGYFTDNEKKIAGSLLSKVPRFVEINQFDEIEVMPLSVWRFPSSKIGGNDPETSKPTISAVGLSYDKAMAAVAQRNGTISVISVPRLVELWQYSTEYKSISCCTFAPDSSFVLFGKLETVLNIAERKEVPFFHGNKEEFTSCAFSPNGKRLVTSNRSSTIKLWDVAKESLLSSLRADVPVNWCSFSSTGLFIIGDWIDELEDFVYKRFDGDAFCVWNAITWQRSDEQSLSDVMLDKGTVIHSKQCHRCLRPGFKELDSCKKLEFKPYIPPGYLKAGVYNGVECIFALDGQLTSVIENTHFSTLAAWNLFVHRPQTSRRFKITAIEDDLWFYEDVQKLIVFKTLAPTQKQLSCLARPTQVLSSSFSPDGSRLATCTSDGYINIWNVDMNQVEQRFQSNQGESSFACWWSKDFMFVFDFFDRIPSLSKYPIDVNLKILFTQRQQVSLCHLVEEFVPLSAVVDFSEGLLGFVCGETNPVKVLDVSGVGGPRMVTLPGIKPGMSITVSPGASFVFGGNESTYYIWKRNAEEEPDVYEVFFTPAIPKDNVFKVCLKWCPKIFVCCFSNDSKDAVVLGGKDGEIFDLDTGDHKSVRFDIRAFGKLFCLNKDRVVITAYNRFLEFFDMDSGARLESSLQRCLTQDSLKQLKLSPKETTTAFPKINGDMEFLRLCIPQSPELSSIKREATFKWHNELEEGRKRDEEFVFRMEQIPRLVRSDSGDDNNPRQCKQALLLTSTIKVNKHHQSDFAIKLINVYHQSDFVGGADSGDESNVGDYDGGGDSGDDNNIDDYDGGGDSGGDNNIDDYDGGGDIGDESNVGDYDGGGDSGDDNNNDDFDGGGDSGDESNNGDYDGGGDSGGDNNIDDYDGGGDIGDESNVGDYDCGGDSGDDNNIDDDDGDSGDDNNIDDYDCDNGSNDCDGYDSDIVSDGY
jgi:WD40 repeat protein